MFEHENLLPCFLLFLFGHVLVAQSLHPDSSTAVLTWIADTHSQLDSVKTIDQATLEKAAKFGRWDLIDAWENGKQLDSLKAGWVLLEKLWTQHRYEACKQKLASIHEGQPSESFQTLANEWKARLAILAWDLDKARGIYLDMLQDSASRSVSLLGLGRLEVLRKNYLKAEALAEQLIAWDSTKADAYTLAAEANFWKREEGKAEKYLQKALQLNPLDADARFAYGYAIWRRRDATLLDEMAQQWEIALKLNPLHYRTHWHWGNGHTHLTYQDYFDKDEKAIRKKLAVGEELILKGKFQEGVQLFRQVKREFTNSVLPELYLASYFYQHPNQSTQSLDTAEAVFLQILKRKPHFGPAHNGLAAVIKKRQMRALQEFGQLEEEIEAVQLPKDTSFAAVFPDLNNYPGERTRKMVWKQLHSTSVYLPMLAKIGRTFAIPPLHQDLAIAMKNSYFRGGTTFDNRQWMDIRGVGSGATGIEYVERGSHLERNVTLHEYVHLFHGVLFTEAEKRDVRQRYFAAMKDGLVLDYYAANNEFEYLAQAIPAYFSKKKVHPLNHKAANTRQDLEEKDPLMFDWVKKLIGKHEAYRQGDSSVLAGNWAEAYMYLSRQMQLKRKDSLANLYLDTALQWAPTYAPALVMLSQSRLNAGDYKGAKRILTQALEDQPNNPSLYKAEAKYWEDMFYQGQIGRDKAIRRISQSYESANENETDFMLRARLNGDSRNFYQSFGLWEEGIRLAEEYLADAPEVSTYLRDEKDENEIYLAFLKGKMGYYQEASRIFERQIKAKPQNYSFRSRYAEVLLQLGRYQKIIEVVEPSQGLLQSAGRASKRFEQLLALSYLQTKDSLNFQQSWARLHTQFAKARGNPWLKLQLIYQQFGADSALNVLRRGPMPKTPYEVSNHHYWTAYFLIEQDKLGEAVPHLQDCLENLPYHLEGRMAYIQLLELLGKEKESRVLAREGLYLPFPPGPFYAQMIERVFAIEDE